LEVQQQHQRVLNHGLHRHHGLADHWHMRRHYW
jgi:hypothetical protein